MEVRLKKGYINGAIEYRLGDIIMGDIDAQQFYDQLRIGASEGYDSEVGRAIMRIFEGVKE